MTISTHRKASSFSKSFLLLLLILSNSDAFGQSEMAAAGVYRDSDLYKGFDISWYKSGREKAFMAGVVGGFEPDNKLVYVEGSVGWTFFAGLTGLTIGAGPRLSERDMGFQNTIAIWFLAPIFYARFVVSPQRTDQEYGIMIKFPIWLTGNLD